VAGTESVLHQFVNLRQGASPQSALVADLQGNLYGTTVNGGTYGFGVVFKLTANSSGKWDQSVLYSFTGFSDGAYPSGSVVLDSSGNLFGATQNGGNLSNCSTGCGVVFELSRGLGGAWTEKVLHTFLGTSTDGYFPKGELVLDSAGRLYGTTSQGGLKNSSGCSLDCGIVYRLRSSGSGWTEAILHKFNGTDGGNPAVGMVFDANGNLYGTTSAGTTGPTAFELSPSSQGWTLKTLHIFGGAGDGGRANGLTFDPAGNLYGTTYNGGANGWGAVFKLTPSQGLWTESVLYSFQLGQDGGSPLAGVILDAAGNLYGTTSGGGTPSGWGTVFKLAPTQGSWTESVIYRFQGGQDGASPWGAPLLMPSGDLLGTTEQGSRANFGTVFDLTPSGGLYSEKQVYVFPATDGDFIHAGLVADSAGNLYGTTRQGGLNQCPAGGFVYSGCGTVFKLSRLSNGAWQRTIIHRFTGGDRDACPQADLIFDSFGNLYGTASGCLSYNTGGVFELSPITGGAWSFRTLYRFNSHPNDGYGPLGGLVLDKAGNLYGTTSDGGTGVLTGNCRPCGTVFKLTPSSGGKWTESVIYNFQGAGDGSEPLAGLVIDSAGNLFGTASGINGCCPTAFELSPNSNGSWTLTVLWTFTARDGGTPQGKLIFDSSANLYGTGVGGGANLCDVTIGCGAVFELSPSPGGAWTESVIYSFSGIPDGQSPLGSLTFDAAGNLYGTTQFGGLWNPGCSLVIGCGTVFKLTRSGGAWTESIVHAFAGPISDGAEPTSGVILDSAGTIYGTTSVGGVNGRQYPDGGTVFQITP